MLLPEPVTLDDTQGSLSKVGAIPAFARPIRLAFGAVVNAIARFADTIVSAIYFSLRTIHRRPLNIEGETSKAMHPMARKPIRQSPPPPLCRSLRPPR